MSTNLVRYWIEFEKTEDTASAALYRGCGVTAFSYEDALSMIIEKIFKNKELPAIINCIENVDIRDLDQGHVIPNMWVPALRGIWFPLGYHY